MRHPPFAGLTSTQRGILVAASAANGLFFFDQTSVTTALARIQRDLGASEAEAQWVIAAYLLPLAALMAASGRFGDLWGRRRLFVGGVCVFGVGSLLCALAPDPSLLIGARALQGVGAAVCTPLGTAAVASAFTPERRGWAIGVLATGGTIFLSLGPLLGGLLTEAASWRWVFVANLPVVVVAAVVGARSFPAGGRLRGVSVDWLGLGLLTTGIAALVVGLVQLSDWGGGDPRTIVVGALAALLLGAFIVVEHRVVQPLVDLRLLRIPAVGASLAALGAIQFAILGLTVYILLYLQHVLGYSPIVAGLLFLPAVAATPLLSPFTGRLTDRAGPRLLVAGGLALAAAGLVAIALVLDRREIALLVPALALFGVSRPCVITPSSAAAIGAAGAELRGLASGLVTCSRQIGAVLGTAVVGAIVASVETGERRGLLAEAAPGIDPADRNALDALLAGASTDERSALPLLAPEVDRAATGAVRAAFTSGVAVALLATAGLVAFVAIAAFIVLRGRGKLGRSDRGEGRDAV